MKKNSGQGLLLVVVIVTIFAAVVVTIATITSRQLELREVEEASLKTNYASDTAVERALYTANKGYALQFDGATNSAQTDYVDIKYNNLPNDCSNKDGSLCLIDQDNSTWDQSTVELWFKINKWPEELDPSYSDRFSIIIGRGTPGAQYGNGREFELAISGSNTETKTPDHHWKYCPHRLFFRILAHDIYSNLNEYWWMPVGIFIESFDATKSCSTENPETILQKNQWYHIIISDVAAPDNQVTVFRAWLDGGEQDYKLPTSNYTVYTVPSRSGGNFPVRLGKAVEGGESEATYGTCPAGSGTCHPAMSYTPFSGAIDNLRIYKHPKYCGNPYAFSNGSPDDPINHHLGIYNYQDDIPCCTNSAICAGCDGGCTDYGCGTFWAWDLTCGFWGHYWSNSPYNAIPNYDMEKDDLILYYNFLETFQNCTASGQECILDMSNYVRGGDENGNNGTIRNYDFSSSDKPLTMPAAPRYPGILINPPKNQIKIDGTMTNGYKYSFTITKNARWRHPATGQENVDCNALGECSKTVTDCCCQLYCVDTTGSPP